MKSLDRFKLKMSFSGNSLRDENISNSKMLLKEVFNDDASLRPGIYMWEQGKESYEDDIPMQIRIFKREFSAANGVRMKFQTLIDSPIITGDVLYDSKADEYLLCTESFNIDDIHWQGKLTLCNWILKWQKKDGTILKYPCHDMNTTQYNSGEQSNKQFTIGSSQHMLTMPYDENTVVLKSPQRFFLDRDYENPTTFIVTQNDSTSYNYGKKGLVKVTVTECAIDWDEDNLELGICDYLDEDDLKDDTGDNDFVSKSVISYDTTVIKSGGSPQTFKARFFDENGNEVKSVIPMWKFICPFQDVLDVEYTDDSIIIGIDDDRFIDEDFKLVLSDDRGQYPSSLIITVRSLI